MSRRLRVALFAVLVAILAAGSGVLVRQTLFRPQTVTAYFSSATGLYPGDEVRIAGVKVGTIRSITPQPEHAAVTLEVDHDVAVPADAKAVIVAQNLVAARYVQLAPLYRAGEPRLKDGAVIEEQRTAVPIEWDEVKTQLSRLATELGPDSTLSSSSAGRFIDSAADAMQGNGDKLRQTFAQLSQLARILSDGSGDVVATIENLQTFVTALRDSSDDLVVFQDRLATFSAVLDDSRSDLDAAMSELAVAVGEVQRFVANTRDKTTEQVQRLANVTQVLADHRDGRGEHPPCRADGVCQRLQHSQSECARRTRNIRVRQLRQPRRVHLLGDRSRRERHRNRNGQALCAVPRPGIAPTQLQHICRSPH